MKQQAIKLLSGLLNISVCLIVVTIILYRQDWFGKGDVYAFIFWTIPLGIAFAVSGGTIVTILKTDKIVWRVLFLLLVSGLIAYGWIYFVFLLLGPWVNTFSFPVFYLWTTGNFFQLLLLDRYLRQNEKPKLILGLVALPLTLIGSVILMYFLTSVKSYLTRPEPETYLIKETFDGRFRVIYGVKCGLEPRIENGRRILEIPDNGLLLIKPEFKAGIVDNEYYLVDSNGGRIKMNQLWSDDQRKTMTPGVLLGGTGSISGPMPDGSLSSESPLAIDFTDFTVFNKDTTSIDERTQFKLEQKFDSLTSTLVEDCRKKTVGND